MRCEDIAFLLDEMGAGAAAEPAVAAHLATCADCRRQAGFLPWLSRELAALPREAAPAALQASVLARVGTGARKACGAAAASVRFAAFDSPLGPLYVAYGEGGILRTGFAMSEADFAAITARLGGAVERDATPPSRVSATVAGFFAHRRCPAEAFDWRPLAEFERRVLRKALEIPWGEVRSYAWIAREIGHPGAARAVGQALGHNPVPLLIPCHRAVRSDGTLGGYAFGLPLKRRILSLEGVDVEGLEREARAGVRYHGSRTTRIFCLPTCRHARRVAVAHRVTFRSEDEARAAGYRPCKVCRPAVAME